MPNKVSSKMVDYKQSATATTRSLESRLQDSVSVLDYGAVGDGVTNDYQAFADAWAAALVTGKDIYIPTGTYLSDNSGSFPFRQSGTPTSLLDCKGIVIYGEGRSTILKTSSANGNDVLQLNGVSNLTVRDLAVTGVQTGAPTQGVNGCSITAGGKNILIENVHAFDLPWYDAGSSVDGGKGFTIQPGTSVNTVENIRIVKCSTSSSSGDTFTPVGFSSDFDGPTVLATFAKAPKGIEVTGCTFECWYQGLGVSLSGHNGSAYTDPVLGALNIPIVPGMGITFTGNTVIGAQYGITLGRPSGVIATGNHLLNSKTAAPSAVAWDTVRIPIRSTVMAFCTIEENTISYAACDHYMRVGAGTMTGGASGASWLSSVSNNKAFGATTGFGLHAFNSGGNYARRCSFESNYFSGVTSGDIDPIFRSSGYANRILSSGDAAWHAFPTAPVIAGTATAGTQTYSTQIGRYTRIGNVVHFTIAISLSALDGATAGSIRIRNLPFTSANITGSVAACTINYSASVVLNVAGGYYQLAARILNNTSEIRLIELGNNVAGTDITVADISSTTAVWLSGSYEIGA